MNKGAPWTPEEDAIMRAHYAFGVFECMVRLPKRPRPSVVQRAVVLGLSVKRKWNPTNRPRCIDCDFCYQPKPGALLDAICTRGTVRCLVQRFDVSHGTRGDKCGPQGRFFRPNTKELAA